MNTQKLDLTRYTDKQLRQFISMGWSMIYHLANGYDKPIGLYNIDFLEVLNSYMIEAANILFEHESLGK